LYYTDVGGEIGRTLGIVRIEIKERVTDGCKSPSSDGPVNDGVLLIRRIHIVHILRIIYSADRFAHADKLARLRQDVPDIAALVDP